MIGDRCREYTGSNERRKSFFVSCSFFPLLRSILAGIGWSQFPSFFFTAHGDTFRKHWKWDGNEKDIFSRHPPRQNTGQFHGIARTWSADKELWRLPLESFFLCPQRGLPMLLHQVQILETWIFVRGLLTCLFNPLLVPSRFNYKIGVNACESFYH